MRYWLLFLYLAIAPALAHVVTLEQIISRENPLYNNAGAQLNIGHNGLVYIGFVA